MKKKVLIWVLAAVLVLSMAGCAAGAVSSNDKYVGMEPTAAAEAAAAETKDTTSISDLIRVPFGYLLDWLYTFTNSYGLALILFSSKNLAVLISFLIVLPVLYTNLLSGIRAADPQLLEMARVFRVPALRGIRYVYLPQVLPYFRSACGSALGLCWKSGIAAEVIGMPDGSIGEQLQQAKIYLNTPDLFAWTLVIVLVSLIFEKVFLALLKRGERALERM